ncbi:histidine phosphatase family protein [Priestia aryabhattai]|uniref:histidine phosphatase family protein n=1 Tax=Priestia aryabhattai TaxID=412384 RepID=UPI001ADB9EB5|nr:histidine phosphatase family protein [Priestia aryabhattai]QTL47329.1 histidine phosphatase family protein [Priestia aryabhattai]
MTKIFLARHGESEANQRGIMESRLDSSLTSKGVRQVEYLASRLKEEELHFIYTSPSSRATKTAEMIRDKREVTLIKDEELYEIDLGPWDGLTPEEAKKNNPTQYHKFRNNPKLYKPEKGENFFDVQKRAIAFLSRIIEHHKDQTVLIVSHGAVLKLMMCYFKGETIDNFWDDPLFGNTSLSLVYVRNNEYLIELDANTSHLPEGIRHLQNMTII